MNGLIDFIAEQLLVAMRHHYFPYWPECLDLPKPQNPDTAVWISMSRPGMFAGDGVTNWTISVPGPTTSLVALGEKGVRVGHRKPTGFADLNAVTNWGGLIPWEHPRLNEMIAEAITKHTAWIDAPPFPADWM